MSKYKLPELHTYRALSSNEQLLINQFLVSSVREDYLFNIKLMGESKTYNLVKLKSINFGYATIDVVFKTIADETIDLPIDIISSIELAGQKEI